MNTIKLTINGIEYESQEMFGGVIPKTRREACQQCELKETKDYSHFCRYCWSHIPCTHTFKKITHKDEH